MRLKVKVIAGAKKESISQEGDLMKVKLAARPVKGKANERLVEVLAEHFGVSKGSVQILKGHASNRKEVEIHGA